MLNHDEKKKIKFIKQSFNTRDKWSKQDYSDFYYRDVSMLLKIIYREILQPEDSADQKRQCSFCGGKDYFPIIDDR